MKIGSVLFCALYLLMPLLQVSGELLHKIAHSLNSGEIPSHHHDALHDSDNFYYAEEHHHAQVEHGHHHEHSAAGHDHKHEQQEARADDHDHDFLVSLQKLVNPGSDGDHDEDDVVPFELDKHLLPLCFEEDRTFHDFVSHNFHVKHILPFIFIDDEGKPPQFRIST